eukprot:CAMPEP_0117493566 /NCGR_PEP_ID=MMETSP0784-20121206/19163_1 /TAXON_ID=39447 /ORGANISM="" /LENGTH=320 /DNA_ID=CAMNT_0005288421 /DNA_START=111 /DNA_END=1073 /DNA_ORIENTATION=-
MLFPGHSPWSRDNSDLGLSTSQLAAVIRDNSLVRDELRYSRPTADDLAEDLAESDTSFSADLVLQEENGFELWLGSMDDALCFDGLKKRGIDGFLNCALEECDQECAVFRAQSSGRGRRRCHARGPSAQTDGVQIGRMMDGCRSLSRDQVRALAAFDGGWYSIMLGCDIAFLGIAADDEPDYEMTKHFSEATEFLLQCRKEGRKVLVHCVMGINRSATAAVAFLCGGLGMSLEEAVNLASQHRGHILSNESFLRQLVESYGHTGMGTKNLAGPVVPVQGTAAPGSNNVPDSRGIGALFASVSEKSLRACFQSDLQPIKAT